MADFSYQDLLGWVALTKPITKKMGGIPRVLPAQFWNITEPVFGDKAKNVVFRGTRKLASVSPYGSPPKQTLKLPIGTEGVRLLHSIESMPVGLELYNALMQFDAYAPQQMFVKDELQRQSEQFAIRFNNLRTAAIISAVSFGKLWFDANGNLQNSSSGADLEIDYGVPAANQGDVSGIIAASWATASTDIPTQVNTLIRFLTRKTGYVPMYAFYGNNIPGYLAKNTYFQQYLARNPQYNQQFVNTGQIADGTLNLKWVPANLAFFEDSSDTVTELFGDDKVVIWPDITEETYALYEGSYPVPKNFAVAQDVSSLLTPENIAHAYGAFGFARLNPSVPIGLEMVRGDTFLPRIKIPESVAIVDTTP